MLKSLALATVLAVSAVAVNTSAADAGPRFRHRGGAVVAAGLLGAAVIGTAAIAASARSCHVERRAVYNSYGEFVGTRRVRVC
jgi:hypothetical protein